MIQLSSEEEEEVCRPALPLHYYKRKDLESYTCRCACGKQYHTTMPVKSYPTIIFP